ncbi:MAG TPA: c-type cytochrome [Vicinamibacterales bacterium]|nr:c-type cytochrome [Vicinamibacterales bacterium]
MRKRLLLSVLGGVAAFAVRSAAVAQSPSGPPAWAYGVPPSGAPAAPAGQRGGGAPADDGSPKHLAGSSQSFTLAQLRDGFTIADWYPEDHPKPPDIVMAGRRPDARACGLCHYPNGRGRPENAGLDGLPVSYFMQQIDDFRHDLRRSAESRKTNTAIMTAIAKAMTDDEVRAAAAYFASLQRTPWIRVVESPTVPKTRLSGGMFVPLEGAETEPTADRIIEIPEHPDRTELRDPRAGFVAYVPVGSLMKGEALVTTGGGGRTIACGICHGADLNGLGPVPGIAGRSPSYQARQLFDMQAGTRRGVWADLMKAVVVKLTPDDVIAITAYTASRSVRQPVIEGAPSGPRTLR